MKESGDHPHHPQASAAALAFAPEDRDDVGACLILVDESDDWSTWLFTVDVGGDETTEGAPYAAGYAVVSDQTPFCLITTTYPIGTRSILFLES